MPDNRRPQNVNLLTEEAFNQDDTYVNIMRDLENAMSAAGTASTKALMPSAARLDTLNSAGFVDKIVQNIQRQLVDANTQAMAEMARNGFGIPEAFRNANTNLGTVGGYLGIESILTNALQSARQNNANRVETNVNSISNAKAVDYAKEMVNNPRQSVNSRMNAKDVLYEAREAAISDNANMWSLNPYADRLRREGRRNAGKMSVVDNGNYDQTLPDNGMNLGGRSFSRSILNNIAQKSGVDDDRLQNLLNTSNNRANRNVDRQRFLDRALTTSIPNSVGAVNKDIGTSLTALNPQAGGTYTAASEAIKHNEVILNNDRVKFKRQTKEIRIPRKQH